MIYEYAVNNIKGSTIYSHKGYIRARNEEEATENVRIKFGIIAEGKDEGGNEYKIHVGTVTEEYLRLDREFMRNQIKSYERKISEIDGIL